MEIKLFGHKITLYGHLKRGFILRIYDKKYCVHFVIDLLNPRRRNTPVFWLEDKKNWKGEYLGFAQQKKRLEQLRQNMKDKRNEN